jgi:4-hydroxy-tetrahydrodipicolinate synthase
MKPLKGVMALTYTPLEQDYSLNEDAVRREIDWVIEHGATGIWPESYSGEWPQLDEETRKRHLKVVIRHAGDKVFCAAGCHSTNTLQAIRLANYAEEIGYDCAWICPPTPRKASEEEIYDHYEMILDKTRLPIGLYNSYPAGTYMSPKFIAKLAQMSERFITMKEPVSDFCHIAGLYHEGVQERISIFGVEWNMLPHLILGAKGTVAGSDWIPVVFAVDHAFQHGDMQKAWQLQKAIVDQSPLLIPHTAGMALGSRVEHSNVGYMKVRFSIMSGIDMGPPMPPYCRASEAEIARARQGIEKIESLLSK